MAASVRCLLAQSNSPALLCQPVVHAPQKSTDVFFLLTALALNSMTAPMTKLTQNRHGGYDYNKSCIYFFAELLKLGVAVTWCIYKVVTTGDRKYSFTQIDCADLMQYAIPGFVFFAQNNLSFIALQ